MLKNLLPGIIYINKKSSRRFIIYNDELFKYMQEFLPDKLSGKKFYDPGKNAREEEMRRFLRERWKDKYGY